VLIDRVLIDIEYSVKRELVEVILETGRKPYLSEDVLPESLQKTLSEIAAKASDRKDELMDVLSSEQPTKSRQVEEAYNACIWWEGCYYCQDEQKSWHRVKCFI
jgi:hypothetical protein